MKNFIQEGNVLELTAPSGGVMSGKIVKIGSIIAVPTVSAAEGELFNGALTGVYSVAKTAADTPAQGAKAYLKADGTEVTTTATANTLIGVFTEARGNGDTEATVRLNGVGV